MSQNEVSFFPLKITILEQKRTPHVETYPMQFQTHNIKQIGYVML